jgi:hypothetical protein
MNRALVLDDGALLDCVLIQLRDQRTEAAALSEFGEAERLFLRA